PPEPSNLYPNRSCLPGGNTGNCMEEASTKSLNRSRLRSALCTCLPSGHGPVMAIPASERCFFRAGMQKCFGIRPDQQLAAEIIRCIVECQFADLGLQPVTLFGCRLT